MAELGSFTTRSNRDLIAKCECKLVQFDWRGALARSETGSSPIGNAGSIIDVS